MNDIRRDTVLRFRVSTNLRFGKGESEKLGEELQALDLSRPAAIVDAAVAAHPQVQKALQSVRALGMTLDVYQATEAEPTYAYLEQFRGQFAGKTYDCLIGIGGGSALDLTKGVATLLVNEGEALSFRGFPKLKKRPLPILALPTTAGTGSESTFNAVFTDSVQKKKLGINSTLNFPACAIVDPLLTVDCPKSVTVSAGADALVHTLESFVHKNHTPLSRIWSIEAFRLIFESLGKVADDPSDLEARARLALGAYCAGIALINAGSGPSGAFSYPLGAVYKVPHGYAGAMFLPSVTRHNAERGYADYALLYDLLEGADRGLAVPEKCRRFADAVQALMDKLGVPKSLGHYGLGPKDVDFMVEQYDVLKAAVAQNPIDITKEDAARMMKALA